MPRQKSGEFDKAGYDDGYHRKNIVQYPLSLNRVTEQRMIDWLSGQSNRQAYIKSLVQKDMEKEQVL